MNCIVFVVRYENIYIHRAKSDKGFEYFFMLYDVVSLVKDKNNSSSDVGQVKRIWAIYAVEWLCEHYSEIADNKVKKVTSWPRDKLYIHVYGV